MALAAMFVVPWAAYLGTVVASTRSTRTELSLSRHLDTARLSARLVDEQCGSALDELKLLAHHFEGAGALKPGMQTAATRDLRQAAGSVEDLVFAGLYRRDGSFYAGHPAALKPTTAAVRRWIRRIGKGNRPVFDSRVTSLRDKDRTEVVGLAARVGPASGSAGYVVAYYRMKRVTDWVRGASQLERIRTDILSFDHATVATTDDSRRLPRDEVDSVLARAKRAEQGSYLVDAGGSDGKVLTGYARAEVPGWVIVVTQPEREAQVVTNYLLLRMIFLCVAVAAAMVLAGMVLLQVYHRQDELTQQLEARNAQLAQQGEAKSDFLANVSHDLWTPLTGLRFAITSLLDSDVPWTLQQVRESLQVASAELDQMSSRVRNLLEMSRIEAHADTSQPQPCDLESLVREALERTQTLLSGRQVTLDFPSEPLFIRCRQEQIQAVLLNLLENAAKYSPPGSPLLMKGYLQEGKILFALDDEGPGICPEDLSRIFEKFYRAQPSHPMGGTGLGLAICKAIIEEHHGRIGATNLPGGGAEFWFSLPALRMSKGTGR